MQNIEFSDIGITGGYLKTRQDINSEVTLIPYYAFANRGETEMQVWLLRKN